MSLYILYLLSLLDWCKLQNKLRLGCMNNECADLMKNIIAAFESSWDRDSAVATGRPVPWSLWCLIRRKQAWYKVIVTQPATNTMIITEFFFQETHKRLLTPPKSNTKKLCDKEKVCCSHILRDLKRMVDSPIITTTLMTFSISLTILRFCSTGRSGTVGSTPSPPPRRMLAWSKHYSNNGQFSF